MLEPRRPCPPVRFASLVTGEPTDLGIDIRTFHGEAAVEAPSWGKI